MADAEALESDGAKFAREAVDSDKAGKYDKAIFFYTEAAQALLRAKAAGSQIPNIVDRANDYILRCQALKTIVGTLAKKEATVKSPIQLTKERATFLLQQAFEEDKNENRDEAISLYSEAVELLLQVRSKSTSAPEQQRAADLAGQALSRAEELKGIGAGSSSPSDRAGSGGRSGEPPSPPAATVTVASSGAAPAAGSRPANRLGPLGLSLRDENPPTGRAPTVTAGGGSSYTKEEIAVLRSTSFINGREYVPFLSVDSKERFAYPVAFSDRHGMLELSPKQKTHLSKWVRPDDFMDCPQMIYAVSSMSIRQTVVSDCSFVASLAVSAQYERRFNKKLITSIIYPQNKAGEPQYNPCGKYMVKLNLNGVPRKVIVDDYLPMGVENELLCSFSNNSNELWVSILEKAYMKVMGGYDFPGSNSNIDLHALTGWIPERIAMRSAATPFDKEKEYRKVHDRFHKGDCLVTVATGELGEAEASRAGLVPSHAYALLDIQEVQGVKLLMLKNPWNHLRWKGNYSERDELHWTPELQRTLGYSPTSAQSFDNGVFWIDYNSFCQFYECIYVNWNPALFQHTSCIHHTWTSGDGPVKDVYNMGENPQYTLQIKQPAEARSAVWILLTRHITDKDDFADNKEFITVLVYKTDGKRVYYPSDPPPYRDGVRINSPHYLVKMVESGRQTYTLVVSQYEKRNSIHYTLRVYAQCEFELQKIFDPYVPQHKREIQGKWEGLTAGGCGNHSTYSNNPLLQLKIDNASTDNYILLLLKAPQTYSVGLETTTVTVNASGTGQPREFSSGPYRRGFCVLRLDSIGGGMYNVCPSTFLPKQEGPFLLTVQASCPVSYGWLR